MVETKEEPRSRSVFSRIAYSPDQKARKEAATMTVDMQTMPVPGEGQKMPGHWLLARLGKRVLRWVGEH